MLRPLFYASLLYLLASPVLAQEQFTCGEPTGSPAPAFAFVESDNPDADLERFNTVISDYLNATRTTSDLQAAIVSRNMGDFPATAAEVIQADITADGVTDVLVHVTVSYGAGFSEYLSLFTCADENFALLDTVTGGGWGGDLPDESPASIVFVGDMNANQRPEVINHRTTIEGQKYHDSLYIYEWDGAALARIFSTGPNYGAYRHVTTVDLDDDPATLELLVGYYYGYGEEVATAWIEVFHTRAIDMRYDWNGQTLSLVCRYFTDQPDTLFETLHSAEAYRACGYVDEALADYERLFTDDSLQSWAEVEWGSLPWIIFPESVEDQTAYAANLERSYLRAFAGYRIAQLALARGDDEAAEAAVNQLQADYAPREHGYAYLAMAAALWDTYQKTRQLEDACAAAEGAFQAAYENGDDPAIEHYEETVNDEIIHYGFYFYSGFRYSPDPDNLFAVPEDIDGMLDIPVCLT
jgi:hypothetical protein